MATFAIERICAGEFEIRKDGVPVGISIFNGSRGLSGRGRNMYGAKIRGGKVVWLGSLQNAKKAALRWAQEKFSD